jgi:hypothetical protein
MMFSWGVLHTVIVFDRVLFALKNLLEDYQGIKGW